MGDKSAIEWTDATWNPLVGCTRVSEGCRHCYAERAAFRVGAFAAGQGRVSKYAGTVAMHEGGPQWTGIVRLVEKDLDLPLRWKRPRRIFVNSMSDLFHEKVSDEWIDRIFAVMALAPQHTFQVLTKRAERMRAYMKNRDWSDATNLVHDASVERLDGPMYLIGEIVPPLPNVWLGVSVEDQATADERIPLLLQTPAALRWVSYEPALNSVDFGRWLAEATDEGGDRRGDVVPSITGTVQGETRRRPETGVGKPSLDWLVIGGESGPGARPFDLAWARSPIAQCRAAGVSAFFKQAGARPVLDGQPLRLKDRKGGDLDELPTEFRVREFPDA